MSIFCFASLWKLRIGSPFGEDVVVWCGVVWCDVVWCGVV